MTDAVDFDLERLSGWMTQHVAGFAGPVTAHKFSGGQSNPTYRLDTPEGSYVLRRKPFGALLPSAHAVDREYRLIAALHPTGFPVPRPYALCEDVEVIGAMFYVMAMVEGRTLWDGTLPDMAPGQRRAHYEAMVDTLADLHAIDPESVGLGDYGRPGNYFERQVGRWTKQYRAAQTDDIPSVERLIDYLPRTVPAQTRSAIVHGDYRIDNMIFAAEEPRILAVLDWELSTLGDPLADFAYFAMNWETEPEGNAGIKGRAGGDSGIPTLDAITERYCARTGRDSVPDLNWYFAYNLFRLMSIVQGIKKRWLDGNASNAKAEGMAAKVPFLADAAWQFAQKAGA
ncbi:phosphotransferase [Stakelama sediminis]|uniref:Aminoglycoside phosphotransferase (APT) family kinase protein n=1 Tax=Stakelama sediminis TaxID=463200 RepID=A0A840YUM6_9SPHN|nr:phosphotransferase family protein [Stakelama sediminis]MBB5717259.1 aminoglycoside phosphotransferase (APT) family kinase protein [Stakelama sediminis]